MDLTKDYQLPEEIKGASKDIMIKYYSALPKGERREILRSIDATIGRIRTTNTACKKEESS